MPLMLCSLGYASEGATHDSAYQNGFSSNDGVMHDLQPASDLYHINQCRLVGPTGVMTRHAMLSLFYKQADGACSMKHPLQQVKPHRLAQWCCSIKQDMLTRCLATPRVN